MEGYITTERIANAIMQNTPFEGHYLVVEGKKDLKLYGKFINNQEIIIKVAFGKQEVKEIIGILTERGFDRKIGIIDADFTRITEEEDVIDGLFITDDHDIEVMIIKTQALEYVLHVFCFKSKIKEFEKKYKVSVRNRIFRLGKEIGNLKLANKIYDLGLVFKPKNPEGKQIKYKNFISDKTLRYLGDVKLIGTVINYSINKSENVKSKEIIDDRLSTIKEKEYPIDQLVSGHDLTNALFILMRKVLNSRNKMLQCANSVEDSLTLAYEFNDFKTTNLFAEIKNWADKNEVDAFNRE
jgi:hypothetical protein